MDAKDCRIVYGTSQNRFESMDISIYSEAFCKAEGYFMKLESYIEKLIKAENN